MKAELKALLKQRVNLGVSERYLAGRGVDMNELLRQQEEVAQAGKGNELKGREFLGSVQGLGLDDL